MHRSRATAAAAALLLLGTGTSVVASSRRREGGGAGAVPEGDTDVGEEEGGSYYGKIPANPPAILNNETLAAVVARLRAEIDDDGDVDDVDDGAGGGGEEGVGAVDYGNHNLAWEDGPSSWEEFGHDNDPAVCRMPTITVDEWESGRYWRGNRPVMVANVTAGWAANANWKLGEMLRRYPDAEATMGDGRRVGKIGPDAAGRLLSPTTVKEFITKHMYDPFKYFFDRKIAIPEGMLEDCRPFPLPTRKYLDDPLVGSIYAPSRKRRVNPIDPRERWRDHLAIAIGADLQGLSFHYHGAAWNAVVFGKKRWVLYDPRRWMDNEDEPNLQRRLALAEDDAWDTILPTAEWIRQLYPDPWRTNEVRTWGMDCIQHAGTMMYVPKGWMHMVVNIGDTVSVISEVGLDMGRGKKAEDFLYDPDAKGDDDSDEDDSDDDDSDDDDESSDDEDGGKGYAREGRGDPIFNDGGPPPVRGRGPPRRSRTRGRGPPPPRIEQDSSDDDSGDSEDSEDEDRPRPRKFRR